jgi:nucleoside-diphosphate-sugar epimerase
MTMGGIQANRDADARIEHVTGDVSERADVERAVAGCGLVYHLAAETSATADAATVRRTNVDGTRVVAAAAAKVGVRRIVFTSNAGSYAAVPGGLICEDSPREAVGDYAQTKLEAETVLDRARREFGIEVVIAIVTHTVGPRAVRWEGLLRALDTGAFRLVGDGSNRLQPCDIADVVDALLTCATTPGLDGRKYLIAGDRVISLWELLQLFAHELGTQVESSAIPTSLYRIYDTAARAAWKSFARQLPGAQRARFVTHDAAFDCSRARAEISFCPRVAMQDSVRSLVAWYRDRSR